MRETGTWVRERWLAAAAAVAINAALLALLAGRLRVEDAAPHAQALQVVWIDAVSDAAPDAAAPSKPDAPESPGAPTLATPPTVRAQSQPPRATPAPQHEATAPTMPPAPDGARPLTAVLLMQVREAAQPRAEDFARRPLADRPATVPGQPADTFRMREALTTARVLAGVGTLFGGSGYRADACPELHRQVAQLGLSDSPADRRHAVALAQALCR